MRRSLDRFRPLPVEAAVLLAPSLLFFTIGGIVLLLCHTEDIAGCSTMLGALSRMALVTRNDVTMLIAIGILGLVLTVRCGLRKNSSGKENRSLIVSFTFIFGTIILCMVAMGLLVCILFRFADPARVVRASEMLMAADRWIFGVYPPFFLHSLIRSPFLSLLIMKAYLKVVTLLPVLIMLLPLASTRLFRTFIISYFLSFMVALPLWYGVPALHPDSMYRMNLLGQPIAEDIRQSMAEARFQPQMENYFLRFAEAWTDPAGEWIAITNFPSMHAAWGVIIAWILIELWPMLAVIALPWLALNLIGTVFTLQHYAVDTLLGTLIGILAVLVAKKLLAREESLSANPPLLHCLHALRQCGKYIQKSLLP